MTAMARKALAAVCAALALAACAAAVCAHAVPTGYASRAVLTPQSQRRQARVSDPWPHGEVNVNTADETALCELYGVGPALASAIVSDRLQNGAYRYPEDLLSVKGIGFKTLAGFRSQLDFPAGAGTP